MALFNSLIRYKGLGLLTGFDMESSKRAFVRLPSGHRFHVFMASNYIVSGADVDEAAEESKASYMIYNVWDQISGVAFERARHHRITIKSFNQFEEILRDMNES